MIVQIKTIKVILKLRGPTPQKKNQIKYIIKNTNHTIELSKISVSLI